MSTYNDNRIPYTYLIGWSHHDKWYYGVRYGKNCNPSDLWATYFTSSKYVKLFRKENGEPDIVQIRKTFNNRNDAISWERKAINRINAVYDDKWLNMSNGLIHNPTSSEGQLFVKNRETGIVIGRVACDHPNIASGLWVSISQGRKLTVEQRRKQKEATKGHITYKHHITGERKYLSVTDPLVISGEYVHLHLGIKVPQELVEKRRISRIQNGKGKNKMITKFSDTGIIYGLVSIDDPRVLDGELVSIHTGRKASPETKEKMSSSHIGLLYWTNGIRNLRAKECPGEGWVRGIITKKRKPSL